VEVAGSFETLVLLLSAKPHGIKSHKTIIFICTNMIIINQGLLFTDTLRTYNGLSADLYRASEYDRLALSLISPLPNEQDFAINVCTLLSNEGKHTHKLDKYTRLIDFLLSHAGVFNHCKYHVCSYAFHWEMIRQNVQTLLLKCSWQGDMEHHFKQQRERREKTLFRPV
jgi:hypothetical protein